MVTAANSSRGHLLGPDGDSPVINPLCSTVAWSAGTEHLHPHASGSVRHYTAVSSLGQTMPIFRFRHSYYRINVWVNCGIYETRLNGT